MLWDPLLLDNRLSGYTPSIMLDFAVASRNVGCGIVFEECEKAVASIVPVSLQNMVDTLFVTSAPIFTWCCGELFGYPGAAGLTVNP